jgi:hypothetical protein
MAMPEITVSIPEMQTRFKVTAVDVSGIPASMAATRAILSPLYGSMQQPKRTSLIKAGDIPARLTASFIAALPMR